MRKIYLLVEEYGFFAHHIKFEKLKSKILVEYFKRHGFEVIVLSLSDFSYSPNIQNSIVFILSSQKPYHKKYLEDMIEFLLLNNNILLPSKQVILLHENKGFQELYKSFIGMKSLKSYYLNQDTIDYKKIKDIGYPVVFKKIDGSGSIGVKLIKDERALKKEISRKRVSFSVRFLILFKEILRKIFFLSYSKEKLQYFKDYENFILQEFIPDLKFDYKVLAFFDKYYVLKRNITGNDFRASGMGNFEFIEVEDSLLEFSYEVFKKLNEPFMALDICYDGNNYHLIEFQGIHFGPYTQLYAKGFYQKSNLKWKFIEKKVSFEEDIAYSLLNHLFTIDTPMKAL